VSPGKIAAAVAAVALVAYVVWRWRRLPRGRRIGLPLLAVALGVYASGVLPALPDAKTVIVDVARALGPFTYVLVGLLAFLETGAFVGLIAPGETVVLAGGVIAGQGEIKLLPLIGLVWACAVAGDTTSFFIGRRLGRDFMLRHGPKVKITRERLEQVESYFQRYGGRTILIGRFIGLVRALAPFIAGSSRLEYRRFIPYSVVGCGLWATLFCLLGYIFWASFDKVADVAGRATFAFGVLAALVFGAVYVYRRLRDDEERRRLEAWIERQSRKPLLGPPFRLARFVWRGLLRPVWHTIAPEVRFAWNRITPGDLGLELTTAVAVAGAGAFTFVLYANAVADHPGPLPFDRMFADLIQSWRPSMAIDAVRVLTDLGSLPVVGTLVLVTAFLLALRGHGIEPAVLIAGFVLVFLAVNLAKAGIDRPRPSDALIDASGSSFPSGHAAYSVAWVAVAVALTRVLPGLASRASVIVAGLAVCLFVAGSRVYLGVHYGSDVLAGLGLGFALYGICAIAGLIVAFIRHNGERSASAPARSAPAAERR
jgi:membrane protein DedA with SNARE-associated domain/membrane-associated phospholipid phosphatase